MKREDVFDKIMKLPVLRLFFPIYERYKSVLLYIFFGGVSFLMNMGLFILFDRWLGMDALINNVICWIACVLFQFFTNRTWVFDGAVEGAGEFLRQLLNFFGGRVLTLVMEEAILAVFISWLGCNAIAVKIVAQIVVIVSNYVISKLWVFRKKKDSGSK